MGNPADLPLVSVIIPAYNAEAFIERTLESASTQTYPNLEIIVVDDGSRDRTVECVQMYQKRDHRIQLFIQANAGVAAARNLAIDRAKGEYIAPLDADDIWHPTKIEHQVAYIQNIDPSVELVYTWSAFIDEDDRVLGYCNTDCNYLKMYSLEGDVLPLLIYQNFIGNASVPLFRRDRLQAIGSYKYDYCEDWELTLRIAGKYKIGVVPAFLVGYRHQQGTASGNIQAMIAAYQDILSHLQQEYPQIEPQVYQWAIGMFYLYLAIKAYSHRQHFLTIYLIISAIRSDWLTLCRWPIYWWLFVCSLKIIARPCQPIFQYFSLIKSRIKKQLQFSQSQPLKFWQIQIYQRPEIPKPSTLYEYIATQRGLQLLQASQKSHQKIHIRSRIEPEHQIV